MTAELKKMSFAEVVADVSRIAAQISEKSIPSQRDDLATLGIDSVAMLDLMAALEEHFGVPLNETMTRDFRTVERIARIIRETAASEQG